MKINVSCKALREINTEVNAEIESGIIIAKMKRPRLVSNYFNILFLINVTHKNIKVNAAFCSVLYLYFI